MLIATNMFNDAIFAFSVGWAVGGMWLRTHGEKGKSDLNKCVLLPPP